MELIYCKKCGDLIDWTMTISVTNKRRNKKVIACSPCFSCGILYIQKTGRYLFTLYLRKKAYWKHRKIVWK